MCIYIGRYLHLLNLDLTCISILCCYQPTHLIMRHALNRLTPSLLRLSPALLCPAFVLLGRGQLAFYGPTPRHVHPIRCPMGSDYPKPSLLFPLLLLFFSFCLYSFMFSYLFLLICIVNSSELFLFFFFGGGPYVSSS